MRQPSPQELPDRKPGRSFDDPSRPLGEDTLARSPQSDTAAKGDFRSREAQADMPANGIAERAKAVAVLRKVEEFIATDNPPAFDDASLQRCFELAAGRVGLTIGEYQALVKDDPEILDLEKKVVDAARSRFKER